MIDKIRIYLDTSIISYLDQQDAPDRMKETQKVWEILKLQKYQVLVSDRIIDICSPYVLLENEEN